MTISFRAAGRRTALLAWINRTAASSQAEALCPDLRAIVRFLRALEVRVEAAQAQRSSSEMADNCSDGSLVRAES